MKQASVHAILDKFEVARPFVVAAPTSGYRNTSYKITSSGNDYNLIIYKSGDSPESIKQSNQVGALLAAAGFPARRPHDERILRLQPQKDMYAGLYNYLPGATIPWEAYTRRHLLALGKTMSRMHFLLQDYKLQLPAAAQTQLKQLERIEQYFMTKGVYEAAMRKLGLDFDPIPFTRFRNIIRALERSQNQQALHMDYVRGNVLFSESAAVSGVIDFEKVCKGHVLFDIARTHAFLLVDCKYKNADQIYRAFMQRGYQKRGPANIPPISFEGKSQTRWVLNVLVNYFMLHDLYKMMLHNPYESLEHNEHFIRTRDYLVADKIIAQIS